jgi:hypothetical protein
MDREIPKIKIGTKPKHDVGPVFYPYILVLKLLLPLKFIGVNKKNQPVFTKLKQ